MKQVNGFWLPDGEQHLIGFLENGPTFAGGPTYQLHKLQACIPHIKNFRTAIDVGAHCGLWSRPMAAMFSEIHAFEPVEEHQDCFHHNMGRGWGTSLFSLHECALGDSAGKISLHTPAASSGDTHVKAGGEHSADMEMLDSFDIPDVDFIKIDCEGFEYHVLKGGEATIKKWKPCIIVEQKPGKAKLFGLGDTDAVTLLCAWGYEQVRVIAGDYIMVAR